MSQLLVEFIKDASRAGKSRDEINAALGEAGWPQEQLNAVWSSFHDKPFPVPIPRPRAYVSPRYTATNLFFFIVFYMSLWAGVSIIFTFLDYYFPDGLGRMQGLYYSTSSIASSLRGYLATLIICVPLMVWTQRILAGMVQPGRQSVPLIRLRLISFTLLIGAFIILGSLICAVNYFLSGELGIRFSIKVAVLLTVIAGIYYYYRPEIRSNEQKA